jgi:sec-independent protein translocase protein TatA
MGTLGVQEMLVIFLVALVLFGPKKLPELGRTIGKALTEFRRASNDLRATFDREMQALERETVELKETAHQISGEIQSSTHIDYSSFDLLSEAEPSNPGEHAQPAHDPSTVGASAVPGAESHETTATASAESPAPQSTGPAPEEHPGNAPVATAGAIEGTVPRTPAGAALLTETAKETAVAIIPPVARPVESGPESTPESKPEHADAEVSQHS